MPDRGFDFIGFQKMNPAAPVLLITGDYVKEGTIPIMEKPFSIKGFRAKVRQLLAVGE